MQGVRKADEQKGLHLWQKGPDQGEDYGRGKQWGLGEERGQDPWSTRPATPSPPRRELSGQRRLQRWPIGTDDQSQGAPSVYKAQNPGGACRKTRQISWQPEETFIIKMRMIGEHKKHGISYSTPLWTRHSDEVNWKCSKFLYLSSCALSGGGHHQAPDLSRRSRVFLAPGNKGAALLSRSPPGSRSGTDTGLASLLVFGILVHLRASYDVELPGINGTFSPLCLQWFTTTIF